MYRMIFPTEHDKIQEKNNELETESWKSFEKTVDAKSWALLTLGLISLFIYKVLGNCKRTDTIIL